MVLLFPAVLYTEWKEKLNFIDTRGLMIFVGGVISALNVADTAVMVVNAVKGVEVRTVISRHVRNLNKPMILSSTSWIMKKLISNKRLNIFRKESGTGAISGGSVFNQVVDVLKMEMYQWKPGGKPDVLPIPESEKEKADELHNALIEAAAENDEGLMELYFEKGACRKTKCAPVSGKG